MNRRTKKVLIAGLLCAGAAALLQTSKTASAEDDAVVNADRAVVQALQKGDRAAAEKLLDVDFSWVDSQGVMWAADDKRPT
jgi:DNA-binding GntR family transcriptional regulator